MTDNPCTVPSCSNPAGDGYVCRGCISGLEQALAETPALLDELMVTRTRERAAAVTSGARGTERALPVHPHAADLARDMHQVLGSWALLLAEERPEWTLPRDDTADLSRWLLCRLETIRCHVAGGECVDEVRRLRGRVMRTIDNPPDRAFIGPCSAGDPDSDHVCPTHLYAVVGMPHATCPTCDTTHDVATRREHMLREAEDTLVTASEAAAALAAWTSTDDDRAHKRLVDRIRRWADRERLETRGHVDVLGRQRTLHRLGDILDLIAKEAA